MGGIFWVAFCVVVALVYGVRARHTRPLSHPRLGSSPGSALLPDWIVAPGYAAIVAPANWLARAGVRPDRITYFALALSVATVPLLACGDFFVAATLVVLSASLDALDGMVARAQGCASAAGAVLDSFTDRIADAAPFIGLALFYRMSPVALGLSLCALLSSFLISYARAKSDCFGLTLPNGFMRRHERIVYLVASLLLGSAFPKWPFMHGIAAPITLMGLGVIGGVGAVAAIQIVHLARQALLPRNQTQLPTVSSPPPDEFPRGSTVSSGPAARD